MTAPKTKEEIVRKLANGWVGGMTPGDEERIVFPAMDVYAKQVALLFYEHEQGVPPEEMESNFDYFFLKP